MHRIYMDHLNGVDCTVRDVSESEDIPQQTVSNAVAVFRAEGLVDEVVHPDDGRVKLLSPTELALQRRALWWSEAVGIGSSAKR